MPPVLRRQLRGYRLAYLAVGLLETLAVGVLVATVAGPQWMWLALAWLLARAARWPSDYAIARRLEQTHPELGETLTAAVQLAGSRDAESLQGSPALRRETYARAGKLAAPLPAGRLVSWRWAAALGGVALVALLAVGPPPAAAPPNAVNPPTPLRTGSPPVPSTNTAPITAAAPVRLADLRARLMELSEQLQRLPESVRRALPAHVRRLDRARDAVSQAAAALKRGDTAEAAFLADTAAEILAEFARLARGVPDLTAMAVAADQLAGQYAAWGRSPPELANRQPITPTGITAQPGATQSVRRLPPLPPALAPLPAVPAGKAWEGAGSAAPLSAGLTAQPVPGYERATREYFERLARRGR